MTMTTTTAATITAAIITAAAAAETAAEAATTGTKSDEMGGKEWDQLKQHEHDEVLAWAHASAC